jgi:hypothetical protein
VNGQEFFTNLGEYYVSKNCKDILVATQDLLFISKPNYKMYFKMSDIVGTDIKPFTNIGFSMENGWLKITGSSLIENGEKFKLCLDLRCIEQEIRKYIGGETDKVPPF